MYLVSNTKDTKKKKVIFFPNTVRKLKKFREDKRFGQRQASHKTGT